MHAAVKHHSVMVSPVVVAVVFVMSVLALVVNITSMMISHMMMRRILIVLVIVLGLHRWSIRMAVVRRMIVLWPIHSRIVIRLRMILSPASLATSSLLTLCGRLRIGSAARPRSMDGMAIVMLMCSNHKRL